MITKEQTLTKEQILGDSKEFSLFSWSAQASVNPLAIERADGVYLYDYDGNRIIDFSSGLMSVNIGHGDQRVTDAVVEQMQNHRNPQIFCPNEQITQQRTEQHSRKKTLKLYMYRRKNRR